MIKRLCLIGLSIIMLTLIFSLLSPVIAAESDGQTAADYLYELGLFRGTGYDSSGAPLFELERSPTRSEALVMLLRLMGLEQEALNSNYSHPFKDTSKWNEPYIAYAYNKGLTKGVTSTRFGASDKATASMYVTFVLRSLGYSDSGDSPDFSYEGSISFGMGLGLIDSVFTDDSGFTRGDAAVIFKKALSLPLHNSEQTLYQRLVSDGVITDSDISDDNEQIADGNEAVLMVPAEYHEDRGYIFSYQTLQRFFPKMARVLHLTSTADETYMQWSDRYSVAELRFIDALGYQKHYERYGWVTSSEVKLPPGSTMYILDSNYGIIAECTAPEEILNPVKLAFNTQVQIDGAKLYDDYRKVIDTVSQNWGKNTFELGEERYTPYEDVTGTTYIRIVKMNGSYVSDGWYCSIWEYNPAMERNPVEDAERAMAHVFFFSDKSLNLDGVYSNYNFAEGYKYIRIDEPGYPANRGFWLKEHNPLDVVIYFFTRDGVYLGQIYIPAG